MWEFLPQTACRCGFVLMGFADEIGNIPIFEKRKWECISSLDSSRQTHGLGRFK